MPKKKKKVANKKKNEEIWGVKRKAYKNLHNYGK